MTTGEKNDRVSIEKKVSKVILENFNEVLAVAFIQIAVRLAVLFPLKLSEDFGGNMPAAMAWFFVAALYAAAVIPLRFWAKEKMRRLFYTHNQARSSRFLYTKWLKVGFVRYGRGIVWGLPFLAGVIYFTVFRRILDYKTFEAPIHWLATLLGGDVSLALGIIFGLMAFFGVIFAYGWGRDLAVEYLPSRSLSTKQVFHWSRRIREKHGREYRNNALVNCLLSLPALAGFGAVLGNYLMNKVDFSLSPDMIFNLLLRALRDPMPKQQWILLAAVFLLLYLPFCILRKTRNAALIARCMKEHSHHHHHHSSQSGSGQESHEA